MNAQPCSSRGAAGARGVLDVAAADPPRVAFPAHKASEAFSFLCDGASTLLLLPMPDAVTPLAHLHSSSSEIPLLVQGSEVRMSATPWLLQRLVVVLLVFRSSCLLLQLAPGSSLEGAHAMAGAGAPSAWASDVPSVSAAGA